MYRLTCASNEDSHQPAHSQYDLSPGEDPAFLDSGFKFAKGHSIWPVCQHFPKICHENEITWTLMGVLLNPPPPPQPPTKPPLNLPVESWFGNFASLAVQNVPWGKIDQTVQMLSLIWIFARCSCLKVVFWHCDSYDVLRPFSLWNPLMTVICEI